MSGVYGKIIDGSQVEDIIESFLQRWLPMYLAEVAADRGEARDAFQAPKSWARSTDFNLDESTQLPAILIISTGMSEAPMRQGDGSFNAKWIIGIGVIVSAGGDNPAEATAKLAKRYGAAIRWLIMQQQGMESNIVAGVTWDDENYDDVPSDQRRSLASARLVFTVEIMDVMNVHDGPVLPNDPPLDPTTPIEDWPTVRDPDSDPPYDPITLKRSH